MSLSSYTYNNTGQKDLIVLSQQESGYSLFSVKAGNSDVVTVEVQIAPGAQRVSIPTYRNLSGDFIGRITGKCYGVGLNISANVSTNIIFDISSE